MVLDYGTMKSYLGQGREIEFCYNNNRYSFSHNSKGWYITEYNNSDYQTFKTSEELLKRGAIDEKPIAMIWPNVTIEAVF